jgi:hypothetical protein
MLLDWPCWLPAVRGCSGTYTSSHLPVMCTHADMHSSHSWLARSYFSPVLLCVAFTSLPCSCVPGLFTREAFLVLVQGGLLVSRTLLTDYISRVEGYCGRALTSLVRMDAAACFTQNAGWQAAGAVMKAM